MENETEHVLFLPYMAQGHLRPFLHLAHHLSSHSRYTITILTTPLNAATVRKNLPTITTTTTTNNIIISELPFNSTDHNLPPNVENTEKLPLSSVIKLFYASKSLQQPFEEYLTRHLTRHHRPPIAVVFDVFLGWADSVARDFNSTGIAFTTGGAYGTAAYFSLWSNLPHRNVDDDSEEFSVPGFPDKHRFCREQLHHFLRHADGSDEWSCFFQPAIKSSMGSSGLLVNSVEEIEPLGFEILRNYTELPVWGVGPLVATPTTSNSNHECIDWLNSHEKDTVLYICFGSQNTINPTQMMELASGLEMSRKPFLWVIRPPFGFDINGEFEPEWLPENFEERVCRSRSQGMLVHKWGPQLEILGHEAVGGFLSHCGWNSILEGLMVGKPIIGWPLAAEQAYNVKMLVEEMGVAVELVRGLGGKLVREEVKKVVEMVMERKEGSVGLEMKRKAVDVGKKLRDADGVMFKDDGVMVKGSSIKAMDNFVEFVEARRCQIDQSV